MHGIAGESFVFALVQTKMSRHSLLTVWHSRQPLGSSELSSFAMIPQMNVVADLTCSEDEPGSNLPRRRNFLISRNL